MSPCPSGALSCWAKQVADHYVEACPECAVGKHGNCDGRTLDHATDEIVPCPCRAGNHGSLQDQLIVLPASA